MPSEVSPLLGHETVRRGSRKPLHETGSHLILLECPWEPICGCDFCCVSPPKFTHNRSPLPSRFTFYYDSGRGSHASNHSIKRLSLSIDLKSVDQWKCFSRSLRLLSSSIRCCGLKNVPIRAPPPCDS
ncbi:hypothetical protein VNO77_44227 [Canavalia gladiata]|uniref:Uncharacterized protein n=1 Tax=Canavalia gladiata TaxID=3824 RepID=A0AAN9JXT8_CANGL